MKNVFYRKRFLGIDTAYLLQEWKAMFHASSLLPDVWAGITVALVALPLNLALALAAGVEPGVGITTAIIASIVTSLFGGQKYAISGPAAAMAVVLVQIAQTHGITAVWLVGMLAGSLQLLAGVLRFGKLISYIPLPVIIGFTNAIGILIVFNSLANFLGIPRQFIAHAGFAAPLAGHPLVPQFIEDIIGLVWYVVVQHQLNIYALFIGSLVIVIALITPRITKVIPEQFIAIIIASVVAYFFGQGIPRIIDISHISNLLPYPSIPNLPWEDLDVLFASAITVFLLGSIESLLSASVADGMTMQKRHHSDHFLVAFR
jgi:MFS superfamily sulfate permease-like transporter